ncbi:unnamed protein product [Menidia menidia]|uniref:(Atlantic silverside) hypothetical protein n=1 Tax=Menidia menidia TaxID=238744 RepID=A0A8S4AM74_9TELE|nr:unnamed protein product [Menidia menidia]
MKSSRLMKIGVLKRTKYDKTRSLAPGESVHSRKATQKKSPWTQTEIRAVERHLMKFISSCMVPGKWECESNSHLQSLPA